MVHTLQGSERTASREKHNERHKPSNFPRRLTYWLAHSLHDEVTNICRLDDSVLSKQEVSRLEIGCLNVADTNQAIFLNNSENVVSQVACDLVHLSGDTFVKDFNQESRPAA